jgi:hypothetical protein
MKATNDPSSSVPQTTQSMPPLDRTEIMLPAASADRKAVRELDPLGKEHQTVPPVTVASKHHRRKKYAVLFSVFAAALLCGFLLAGYYHDRQQLTENDRLQQEQSLTQREAALKEQKTSLLAQRAQLEQEKKNLEQRQRDLQAQADRAQGKNDQLQAEAKSGSAVGKLWDKVTGKEKERQQDQKDNAEQGGEAAKAAAAVGDSIDQAQTMLNDVDHHLQDLNAVHTQVTEMKQAAASAYADHADILDQAAYYVSQGVAVVKNLLTK